MTGWLSGWTYRRPITIDHTKITNSDLTNFPVLLYLSTSSGLTSADISSIFTILGANRKKIAVTTSDGTTQCYVEIEKWDNANNKAWLWVKVPTVSYTADTVLYLYYDVIQSDNTTYIGDIGDAAAQAVWDSNFVLVVHMRDGIDNSHLKDSTSNNYAIAKKSSNHPAVNTSGKISDDQSYASTDYAIVTMTFPTAYTIEAWVNSSGTASLILTEGVVATYAAYLQFQYTSSSGGDIVGCHNRDGAYLHACASPYICKAFNTWYYCVYKGSAVGYHEIYVNGLSKASANDGYAPQTDTTYYIGRAVTGGAGNVDEIRVSKVQRLAEWIYATYCSGTDTFETWGAETVQGTLSGITRDSSGNPLGSCTVLLFLASSYAFVLSTTSDVNGNYSFSVVLGINYFVVAFKAGTPDVEGCSDNNLQGS